MGKCLLCGQSFKSLTNTHLKARHHIYPSEYKRKFPGQEVKFFAMLPNLQPKESQQFKNWRNSLKKRSSSWNKGYTKETHLGVLKISETMKQRKINNFAKWQVKMKMLGKIRSHYPPIKQNGDLAELIGVILGDGHIEEFARTEGLTITSNANNPGFVKRYAYLLGKLFDARPTQGYGNKSKSYIRIRIYQRKISERLNIPTGSRKKQKIEIPSWVLQNKEYLVKYLRGLYEAEGSFGIHKPTYTYKLIFSNRNKSLLKNVYRGLKILGFHPHKSPDKIQVSRKEEVYRLKDLIKYRQY